MSILDLNQPAKRNPLVILLRLLVREITAGNRPALNLPGERDGAGGGESEVVGGTEGDVSLHFEIADRVGADLEVADGEAVGCLTAEGLVVDGLDGEWDVRAAGGFTVNC